jgi:hypothetical protein
MINCQIGPLVTCEPRELLKVRVAESTQWAIVGVQSRGYFPLILLTGENPVTVVNVAPDPGDFERFPVVKFGREYRLLPEVNGKCEIGDTPLSKSPGSIVFAQKQWYLVVQKYQEQGMRWVNVQSGDVQGEPGSDRIAFASWTLWLDGFGAKVSETAVVAFP